MKSKQLITAMALVVACGGVAQADTWTGIGADNEFSTALNWDTTNAPVWTQCRPRLDTRPNTRLKKKTTCTKNSLAGFCCKCRRPIQTYV